MTRVKTSFLSMLLLSAGATVAMAQEPIQLRMTALAGPAGQGVQSAIAAWNEKNPDIQVSVELQADETNWQALCDRCHARKTRRQQA